MKKPLSKNNKAFVWVMVTLLIGLGLVMVACQPSSSESTTEEQDVTATVDLPTPNENGVIVADQWKDIHPAIYDTFMMNTQNTERVEYTEVFPFIVTLYDPLIPDKPGPNGFALHYESAIGHPYALEDVNGTKRPHALANCLTCKTPEFIAILNAEGIESYKVPFDEMFARVSEPISCYSCHANDADGALIVSSSFLSDGLGADAANVPLETQVCGQCHVEYHFNADTSAVTLPYSSVESMHPDVMLQYYNDLGFKDFVNVTSGTEIIKIQHPEMEFILGEGSKVKIMGNFSCASCHMGEATDAEGTAFSSHYLTSPFDNQDLLDNTCNAAGACHTDLVAQVKVIQDEISERGVTIGYKLEDLHKKIAAAAADGSKTEDELAALRSELRNAQFYWDYCFVENSNGAHNSALARYVYDRAESIVDEALAAF